MSARIVVGSRESQLAVVQSMTVVDFLRAKHSGTDVELLTMKTTGDRILDRTLDKMGGKGLFVKELDVALRQRRADVTVSRCALRRGGRQSGRGDRSRADCVGRRGASGRRYLEIP